MDLYSKIRTIMDFPKKGIGFKDITTLLKDKDALCFAVDEMIKPFKDKKIDKIAGIESRGFIFGMPIAYNMKLPFIPIRKPGKLPAETVKQTYELEYGTDAMEIHKDAVNKGENILIVDDLLATGGTMEASINLIKKLGANPISITCLIELSFLNGRERLQGVPFNALLKYEGE